MKWNKKGKIFDLDSNHIKYIKSHAAVPFADNICGDKFKVYFSGRDDQNRSVISYFVIDIKNPKEILEVASDPVLLPGSLGEFDDSGVMGSSIINIKEKKYLYYIGWNLGVTVPFRNSIGLAVSKDNGESFRRLYEGPIIDRTRAEPHFCASNCVIEDEGIYKIWYLSCVKWEKVNDEIRHYYHIKYAESKDGIEWKREGKVAIDFESEYEYAISVPRVIKENGIYKMWFSSRATKDIPTYRIRYAESQDGIEWVRKTEIELGISNNEWESEMVCYPFVFRHKEQLYMLYNGNGYGKTGIGLAVLEDK